MGIELRCEKCGKLLSVEAPPGSTVQCPHCRKHIEVPAGPASLPEARATSQSAQPAAAQAEAPHRLEAPAVAGMGVMMLIMPWVISVLLHLGLALVMIFITMYVLDNPIAEDVVVPDAKLVRNPGGPMTPRTEAKMGDDTQDARKIERRHESKVEAIGRTREKASVMAMSSSGAGSSLLRGLPGSGAPRSKMFGVRGGNVYHVAYLIDRSGSMVDTFDQVCQALAISIGELQEIQDFHVILFAEGPPIEYGPKRLVPASARHKEGVAEFLEEVRAEGQTNPIPALMRAFGVLQGAGKGGKLIYLLTDGEFPNNEMVIAAIRQWNANKSIHINTFLYGRRPPEAERVMKLIADENGGRYKYVSPDE